MASGTKSAEPQRWFRGKTSKYSRIGIGLLVATCHWIWDGGDCRAQAQESSPPAARNSTRKLRVQPSKVASRIGSAVQWRDSLADAQKESRATGKPVFWYINTVPDTFTDRKIEIDRYMLAGPFSWPKIIQLLNSDFIPVRQVPDAELAQTYGLRPYDFVEPGFLVLDSNAQVTGRVDHVTTLAPAWLLHLFREFNGKPKAAEEIPNESIWSLPPESAARTTFESFMAQPQRGDLDWSVFDQPHDEVGQRLEAQIMKGMIQYYSGDHATAQATWRAAIDIDPNHPLAWKAAAEREGFGPFVRGFEVFGPLPSRAWSAGIDSVGSAAPKDCYSQVELWDRSVTYLLAMQRADGAVIDSDYDFGGTDSLPNVHVAVTSLVGLALLEARMHLPQRKAELDAALTRISEFVKNETNINVADRDEILWAYAYRLRFLVARVRAGADERDALQRAVAKLESVQGNRGSWYHEYSNSFVTATALVALADAKQVGANINQEVVDKGLKSLLRDRYGNGAYPYSNGRDNRMNQGEDGDIPASAGRMPICELALYLWGQSDQTRLQFAVEQSLLHHDKLNVAYKYDNHTSTLAYGGFFFWYDMESRTEAIRSLNDQEAKTAAAKRHQQLVLALPEIDGCFVDSHELGRCYGTAMALQSMGGLSRVLDARPN
ncbi:MAG: terpene cyclase/mutase family protein [Planctomycetaceae bacterium]|nr:terpene cyclase/mutase family protein [Planctomycetaceae bacterium]